MTFAHLRAGNMSTRYRVGIIGVGAISEMHARALGDLDNAKLVAASCRTEEKGTTFAKQYGCKWYANYEDLYDEVKPDVVTICTPSGAHLEPTVAAAQRGIHVLCEKPLEINLERAEQMIQAAEAAGIKLGGIFPQRFNPVVRMVFDVARAGRFGHLVVAVAYVPWWRDDDYYAPSRWQGTLAMDGGGALINQSIHSIDAIQWIAAAAGAGPVRSVFGLASKLGHPSDLIEVEDMAVACLQFEKGALGNIVASTAMWPGNAARIHISGRDGTVEVHDQRLVTWSFREETPEDEQIRQQFGSGLAEGGASDPMAIDYSNHTRNIADFLRSVDSDDHPLSIDGREACRALATIRGIYESVERRQAIQLDAEH